VVIGSSTKSNLLLNRIISYVNNLHPYEHRHLYDCLDKIIAAAIPLWNAVLTPLRYHHYRRWKGPFDPKDAFSYEYSREEDRDEVNLVLEYAETGLQVIVELVEINLRPEQPKYPGGGWQASG
jgi:hypothetical protein